MRLCTLWSVLTGSAADNAKQVATNAQLRVAVSLLSSSHVEITQLATRLFASLSVLRASSRRTAHPCGLIQTAAECKRLLRLADALATIVALIGSADVPTRAYAILCAAHLVANPAEGPVVYAVTIFLMAYYCTDADNAATLVRSGLLDALQMAVLDGNPALAEHTMLAVANLVNHGALCHPAWSLARLTRRQSRSEKTSRPRTG
jgi:hypothetical protein